MFAGIAGLLIGFVARFLSPHRGLFGAVTVPAWSGVTALVLWEALTWLGSTAGLEWLAYDRGWIWGITLAVTALVAVLLATSLGSNRERDDRELFDRLSHLGRSSL